MIEKNIYKELDPELRDWEYDGHGKKRHKKAFHLSYENKKTGDIKECGSTKSANSNIGQNS